MKASGAGANLSPAVINFGYQLIGTTSPEIAETITNSGAESIVITDLSIRGGDRNDFALSYGFTLPYAVAPGASVTLNISFTPAAPWSKGTREAKLKIEENHGKQTVELTGLGVTCASAVTSCNSDGLCTDTDGDGFNDVWEDNGYIDLNNNGKKDAQDFHFPRRTQHIFSPVSHSGTGTGQVFPSVVDPTLPINNSTVSIIVAGGGNVNSATFTYSINGGPPKGPLPVRPVVDISGNRRLMFYLGFVAGDTYTFTTSMGTDTKIADRNVPNVYVQYDYMDWDAPGGACTTNDDCVNSGGASFHPNDVCHQGFCSHNHYPGDPLLRKVVDQFAAHGITLYIDPVHDAVPHAQVLTWFQHDNGGTTLCAGADVVSGNIGPGQFAVNFHDIKYRPGSDFASQPVRKNIYHYAIFGHLSTCLTDEPGATVGNCGQCPSDRSTPRGSPRSNISGLAELPGNDFMITLAASLFNPIGSAPRNPFIEEGVFMHELGHNLGLHHAGDQSSPDLAPNYLSVMNSKYVFSGIQHAATPGSKISVEGLREVNYSEHTLNTLVEGSLDEMAGVSALSTGYTGLIRFFDASGGNGVGPEAGPIDWTGDGFIDTGLVSADLNSLNGITETMFGYSDWIHGPCTVSPECRINQIRLQIHDLVDLTVDPHEPCVQDRCQSLWLPFQCTQWGKKD
jgi:hypothetical protein